MKVISIYFDEKLIEFYKKKARQHKGQKKQGYQTLIRKDLEENAARKYGYNPALQEV